MAMMVTSVEGFLAWCAAANYSHHTIRTYRILLNRFVRDVGDPLDADAEVIAGWLRQFQGHAPETRRANRSVLSSFWRWAVDVAEIAERSPMGKIPPVRVPRGAPRPIPGDPLARALATADLRMRCWLLLGCDAGLRRSEIAYLTTADIGERITVVGKGGKFRTVPISTRLRAALDAWPCEPGARLWNVTPGWIGKTVAQHLRASGADATCHQLRHSFACRVYIASGADLLKTQRLLGHASPTTTARYAMDDGDDDLMDRLDAA